MTDIFFHHRGYKITLLDGAVAKEKVVDGKAKLFIGRAEGGGHVWGNNFGHLFDGCIRFSHTAPEKLATALIKVEKLPPQTTRIERHQRLRKRDAANAIWPDDTVEALKKAAKPERYVKNLSIPHDQADKLRKSLCVRQSPAADDPQLAKALELMDKAPEWAEWVAQNHSGMWSHWDVKPSPHTYSWGVNTICESEWFRDDEDNTVVATDAPNWREQLFSIETRSRVAENVEVVNGQDIVGYVEYERTNDFIKEALKPVDFGKHLITEDMLKGRPDHETTIHNLGEKLEQLRTDYADLEKAYEKQEKVLRAVGHSPT